MDSSAVFALLAAAFAYLAFGPIGLVAIGLLLLIKNK